MTLNTTREELDAELLRRHMETPSTNSAEEMCDLRPLAQEMEKELARVRSELVAMTVQGALHMTNAEELEKERDKLREELESARLELTQWRRGVPSFAHSTRTNRQATEQWERWHARLLERFGGRQ